MNWRSGPIEQPDSQEMVRPTESGRNPDWSRDETALLMDLYLSAPNAAKSHPEVVALSLLLRTAAKRQGRSIWPSFRNPAGIAMRLRNFGKFDPAAPPSRNAGLRPGGVTDRLVWKEFGTDRAALAWEVEKIRRSMGFGTWTLPNRSSRGPAPYYGSHATVTADGSTGVYLVLIDGPLDILAPQSTAQEGYKVVKLGRTADLERRLLELTCGLPPTSHIRYLPIGLRTFTNGNDAHRFERLLLNLCNREGWSLGGEFAYAPLAALRASLSMAIENL